MSNLDPADFRKGAQVIRDGGLAKGMYYRASTGGHCAVGALRAAKCHNNTMPISIVAPEVSMLAELLGGQGDALCPVPHDLGSDFINQVCAVANWNDQPDRTAEEVATLLEQAAEKLEAER